MIIPVLKYTRSGGENSRLHRQDGVQETGTPIHKSSGVSGVCNEPLEEHFRRSDKVDYPGDGNLLSINDISCPHKEEGINSGHGQIDDTPEVSISKRYGKHAEETKGDNRCVLHDPSV